MSKKSDLRSRFSARLRAEYKTEAYIDGLRRIEAEKLALRRNELNQFNKVELDLLEMDSARWADWKSRVVKLIADCRKNNLRGADQISSAAERLNLKSLGGMRLTARHIDILRRMFVDEIRVFSRKKDAYSKFEQK